MESDEYFVRIIEWGTERIERELGPYGSLRLAERAEDGVLRNLDQERFYTETDTKRALKAA